MTKKEKVNEYVYESRGILCLTKCKFKQVMVGSNSCKECKFYKGKKERKPEEKHNIVLCSHPTISNVTPEMRTKGVNILRKAIFEVPPIGYKDEIKFTKINGVKSRFTLVNEDQEIVQVDYPKKKREFKELGDLVEYKLLLKDGHGKRLLKKGVIMATAKERRCASGGVIIGERFVQFKDITRIIKKNYITKEQMKYLRGEM